MALADPRRARHATAFRRRPGRRIGRERRLVMLMLGYGGFPGRVLGRAAGRGAAGADQYPADAQILVRYVLEDSRAEAVAISEPLLAGFAGGAAGCLFITERSSS